MKKLYHTLLLLIFAGLLSSAGVHKYYVAVFQMEHKPQKKTIQVTGRIFIDDLEKALNAKYGKTFYLATAKELPETTATIKQYLLDKVTVTVNGKAAPLTFLAKEVDDDILVCYLTVPAPKKVTSIEVRNTVLQDMFHEQQNMINTRVNNERKSLLLTRDTPSGTVTF
ncbi:DUF6702 family protein [Flavobacterium sp. RHBU_24]|uniref:DUF6702 family protein n=1 Tax=Flavobacterium sp. RHBU_24 TaxID=3391185 RepID=UPI0039849ED1